MKEFVTSFRTRGRALIASAASFLILTQCGKSENEPTADWNQRAEWAEARYQRLLSFREFFEPYSKAIERSFRHHGFEKSRDAVWGFVAPPFYLGLADSATVHINAQRTISSRLRQDAPQRQWTVQESFAVSFQFWQGEWFLRVTDLGYLDIEDPERLPIDLHLELRRIFTRQGVFDLDTRLDMPDAAQSKVTIRPGMPTPR